jgi:hypothetical protein
MVPKMEMNDPTAVPITEADVAGFAAKLGAWYEMLPPGEQAVLQQLVACAEAATAGECEVEGYALPGMGARLVRLFAAGLLTATLATSLIAPPAASAAGPITASVVNTQHPIVLTPEQIIETKAASLGPTFTGTRRSTVLEHVEGGVFLHYDNCDIYYSQATGAHEVHGAIRDKFNDLGGVDSRLELGLPTCDESGFSDGVGRYSGFANGALIVRHPDTGPMLIKRTIKNAWLSGGGTDGPLGYPTSDEVALGNGAAYSDFQNDVIYWDGSKVAAPLAAVLPKGQVERMVGNLLLARMWSQAWDSSGNPDRRWNVESVELSLIRAGGTNRQFYASDTGYDFYRSRNRLIQPHVAGEWLGFPGGSFTIDPRLHFFAHRETDGSTTLRLAVVDWRRDCSNLDPFEQNHMDDLIDGILAGGLRSGLALMTIPASVNVLSVKAQLDGAIRIYVQPSAAASAALPGLQKTLSDLPNLSLTDGRLLQ